MPEMGGGLWLEDIDPNDENSGVPTDLRTKSTESRNCQMIAPLNIAIQAAARAAHEANRAYCIALGDDTQAPWEDAPEWQRSSALNGVTGVLDGNTPEESHKSWLSEKERTGWRFGFVKDPEKKEHPCFVPYAELPPAQREKDGLFVSTVLAMMTALGWAQNQAEHERAKQAQRDHSRGICNQGECVLCAAAKGTETAKYTWTPRKTE